MQAESKTRSADRAWKKPFARAAGTNAFTFEAGGRSGPATVGKSMDSLLRSLGVARPTPGGADDVEDPLVDSWAVSACRDAWARAVRGVPLRIWASDDPEAKEVPANHPLRKLLEAPALDFGWGDLIEACYTNWLESGEDWLFFMDGNSQPVTADANPRAPIPLPRWMLPVSGKIVDDKRRQSDNRILSVSYGGGGTQRVDFGLGSTLQHRRYNHLDPQRGMSPIQAALRAISVGFQAERYQEGVMRAGGPGAYINFKDSLDPVEERRIQEEANEANRDPDVLGGVRVVSGDAKIEPNPATPKDMLPQETLDWSRNVVCSATGTPPPIIGVFDDATYNNISEARREFWTNVKSWLDAWAQKFNENFLARLNIAALAACRISFDFSGVQALQQDNSKKFAEARALATSGVPISFNDALVAQGVEVELPTEAETIVVPDGFAVFDPKAGEKAEAAAAAAGDKAVQDTGLNGAQITGIIEVLTAVSEGRLDKPGAIALLQVAFPNIDAGEASRIVNGAQEVEPEPEEPPPGAGGDDDEDEDPPEDATKSLPAAPRALPALDTAEERAAYHARLVERVLSKPEREFAGDAERWFAAYEAAQIALVEDFAANGPNTSRSLPAVQRDLGIDEEIERFLLLIEERWALELGRLSRTHLESAFTGALDDIAQELSVVQINATDPRVATSLAAQEIRLAEGVTSRLAETVKTTILEALADPGANAAAPLQLQIRDRLPELTENLRRVFGTKEARAATIARTETAQAVSNARDLQMKDAGVSEVQWIANDDEATRESHRQLDGAVRRVGEEFKAGLRRPHDPEAPPSETVNCRCGLKPIVP